MIIRISNEGQYELSESDGEVFQELDNQAIGASEADDEEQFRDVFKRLIEFVRRNGQAVPDDRLAPSDVILPPPDSSLAEAKAEFTGEGLIPG